jgi:hypothetical protein
MIIQFYLGRVFADKFCRTSLVESNHSTTASQKRVGVPIGIDQYDVSRWVCMIEM